MTHYSIEPMTRKYVRGYGFLSFSRNLSNKYRRKVLDAATKIGQDALKTSSKKVVCKAAETPADENSRNAEEIVISPEKKRRNTKRINRTIIKWNTKKYSNY